MPIEIKELHIKVTVNPPQGDTPKPGQTEVSGTERQSGRIDRDALIAECVEQVLQILHDKTER